MRIHADREVCVGAGMCVMTAPFVFDQSDDDGRVVVLEVVPASEMVEEVREAVMLCPSGALSIEDDAAE